MKYWMLVILEDSCSCGSCGILINEGKLAFILVDTSKPAGRVEWVDCLDCLKWKFPKAVEVL